MRILSPEHRTSEVHIFSRHSRWNLSEKGIRLTFSPTLKLVFAVGEGVSNAKQAKPMLLTHRILRSFSGEKTSVGSSMEATVKWNYKRKGGSIYRFNTKRHFGSLQGNLFHCRKVLDWPEGRDLKLPTSKFSLSTKRLQRAHRSTWGWRTSKSSVNRWS
jgi:hypothetical protein